MKRNMYTGGVGSIASSGGSGNSSSRKKSPESRKSVKHADRRHRLLANDDRDLDPALLEEQLKRRQLTLPYQPSWRDITTLLLLGTLPALVLILIILSSLHRF
mmetsp:Transcript_4589/g.7487  ORF Transcript_4589/g.7487 Transcript_4589/m.7487 type:complete len:103 (+) Transcript_4589:1-309(+)